jgi:hypothetical protein
MPLTYTELQAALKTARTEGRIPATTKLNTAKATLQALYDSLTAPATEPTPTPEETPMPRQTVTALPSQSVTDTLIGFASLNHGQIATRAAIKAIAYTIVLALTLLATLHLLGTYCYRLGCATRKVWETIRPYLVTAYRFTRRTAQWVSQSLPTPVIPAITLPTLHLPRLSAPAVPNPWGMVQAIRYLVP